MRFTAINFSLALSSCILLHTCLGLELRPIRPHEWSGPRGLTTLTRRDAGHLNPQNHQSFLWEGEDGDETVLGNFTIHTPGANEQILSTENFEPFLSSIDCTPTSLKLGFVDNAAFAHAQEVWDWVNGEDDRFFIMVAGSGDCGDNAHRVPYLVQSLVYDETANSATLQGNRSDWRTLVHAYQLQVGKIQSVSTARYRRDDSSQFKLNNVFDFSAKVQAGPLSGQIECGAEDCFLQGTIDISADISFGLLDVVDKAIIRLQPKGVAAQMKPKLTAGVEPQKTKKEIIPPWTKSVLPQPVPIQAIVLGDVVTLGLVADLLVGIEMGIEGQISVTAGAKATLPDTAFVEIDLENLSDGPDYGSWTPRINMLTPEISGSVAAKFKIFAAPNLRFEASAGAGGIEVGYQAGLQLNAPYYEASAKFSADSGGGLCDANDVTAAFSLEGSFGAELKFTAGKIKDKPAEWTIASIPDIFKHEPVCIPILHNGDKPKPSGSSTTTSKPKPTTTTSVKSTSTPTCKNNAGTSGTCISISSCSNLGGNAEAGHCPGAANIQCCTFSKGSGDTCTANGVSGTCMPTTSCPDDTGVSIPGHCRGPTDVQCCVTKQSQDQATAKNVCEIDKAGLSTSGFVGECISTSSCRRGGGTSTPGFCPGGNDNQCCTYGSCEGKGVVGVCEPVSTCTGTNTPGLCGGGTNIQCCSQNFAAGHPGQER